MIGCGDKRNVSVKRGLWRNVFIERGGGREGVVLGERGVVGRERGGEWGC